MTVCPNLLEGFKMLILLFIHGPDNVGYMESERKSSLQITKFTVFLPLLPAKQVETINKMKYLQISDDLRTINLVLTTSSQIISEAKLPSEFYVQWIFNCGKRSMLREYLVTLTNRSKIITAAENNDDTISIFRGKLIKVDASGNNFVIYFSFNTPVSTDIIGKHRFSLLDGRGEALMSTVSLLIIPANNQTVLPTKGKICRGSSKICDVIVLPNRQAEKYFTCRRSSDAQLDLQYLTSQMETRTHDSSHPFVIFTACVLVTITFTVLSVTVIRLKSYEIGRLTA